MIELPPMTEWEVDQWSSHRLILAPLLERVTINNAVELGVGMFSTRSIAEGCIGNLLSLETEEPWVHHMREVLKDVENLSIVHNAGPLAPKLKNYLPIELLFIDHSGDRLECAEAGMELGIPYIVLHDFTEEDEAKVKVSEGYTLFSTRGIHFNPTALYTVDTMLAASFQSRQIV